MNIMNPQGSRIYEAAFSLHSIQDPAAVATLLQVEPQTLHEWCCHGVPDHCIEHCSACLNCDELWLLMGIGCMTRTVGCFDKRPGGFELNGWALNPEASPLGQSGGEDRSTAIAMEKDFGEQTSQPDTQITLLTSHPQQAVSSHAFMQAANIVARASKRVAPEQRSILALRIGSLADSPSGEG